MFNIDGQEEFRWKTSEVYILVILLILVKVSVHNLLDVRQEINNEAD